MVCSSMHRGSPEAVEPAQVQQPCAGIPLCAASCHQIVLLQWQPELLQGPAQRGCHVGSENSHRQPQQLFL